MICKVTGASRAVVNNSGFRRKPVALQNDPNWVHMKGTELDKMLCALPRDRPLCEYFAILTLRSEMVFS